MAFRYDAGFMKPLRLLLVGFFVLPVLACTSADIRPDAVATGGSAGGTGSGGGGGTGGTNTDASTNDDHPLGGEAGGETGGGGGASGEDGGGETGGGGSSTGGSDGTAGIGGGGHDAGGASGGVGGAAGQAGGRGGTATGGSSPVGGNGGLGGASGGGGAAGSGGAGAGGSIAACVPAPAGAAVVPGVAGQLVVSELMHSTVGLISDGVGEWFEIYNPSSTTTYQLQGCKLTDANPSSQKSFDITTSVLIPPCTYFSFAISATPGFTPSSVYSTIKFGNDHEDGVRVVCGNAVEIAAFRYSLTDAMNQAYNGHSYSVDPSHFAAPGGTPGTFCPGTVLYPAGGSNYGTPGAPNPSCN